MRLSSQCGRALWRLLAIASLVLAAGCDAAVVPERVREASDSGGWEPTDSSCAGAPEGTRLCALVSADTLVLDDSLKIRVVLTNPTPDSVTLTFSQTCTVLWQVRNAADELVVPDGGWACGHAITEVRLAPADTREVEAVWTGRRLGSPTDPDAALPEGTYDVLGYLSHPYSERGAEIPEERTEPVAVVLVHGSG